MDDVINLSRAERAEKLRIEGIKAQRKEAKENAKRDAEERKKKPKEQEKDFLEGLFERIKDDELPTEEFEDNLIAPPKPDEAMFYGFVGEVARIAATGTEINKVSAALAYMSFLSANVGRDTFMMINNTVHHPRLYTMHIGSSAMGGKGDSQQLTHRIRKHIDASESGLLCQTHTGGLSSREGLASLIHDGYGESPAIIDKRLWIIESEFSNVLHQARRDGNTLSSALREVWDGGDIKPATKSKPFGVTAPHIAIHANITPGELRSLLSSRDISNGFSNRFFMIHAENTGLVPYPEPTPEKDIIRLSTKTREIIHYAKGGYPNSVNGLEMTLNESAKEVYASAYLKELKRPLESEILSAMLNRRAPHVLRLSMLFALTDFNRVIGPEHVLAAIAWVRYSVQSVRFIFSDMINGRNDSEMRKNAEMITDYLSRYPEGVSKTDLIIKCFQKHTKAGNIDLALRYLLSENPPKVEQIEEHQQRGRPKKTYRLKQVNLISQAKTKHPKEKRKGNDKGLI